MRRVLIALWLAATWRPLPTAAQSPLGVIDSRNGVTLEQAIAEGLRAEPGLRAAASEVDAARGAADQATKRPNPGISFEQREQMGGSDRQTSIGVDLPLDLFSRGPRIDSARHMAESSAAEFEDRRRLLAATIRDQYGEVLIAVRRAEVLDGVLSASRRTYELLRDRVGEGATPPLERDIALVEVRRLEGDRELALGRITVAVTRLKALVGRTPASPLVLGDSLESLDSRGPSPGPTAPERADIKQASADLAAASARTHEASAEGKPDIGLFGGYMRMDAGFPQLGLGPSGVPEPIHGIFNYASIGFKLTIPVFNRGQGDVAAAKARELTASATLDAKRLAAAAELAAAAARVDASRRALATYSGEARGMAQRNLDVVRETYTLGRATLFDVFNEQRRYLDFESGYTEALAEAFFAQTDLKRALGELQ
jgi:cobalt-zinc-cadmium efflux system outer membrane protein